jgi:hypothetical protein
VVGPDYFPFVVSSEESLASWPETAHRPGTPHLKVFRLSDRHSIPGSKDNVLFDAYRDESDRTWAVFGRTRPATSSDGRSDVRLTGLLLAWEAFADLFPIDWRKVLAFLEKNDPALARARKPDDLVDLAAEPASLFRLEADPADPRGCENLLRRLACGERVSANWAQFNATTWSRLLALFPPPFCARLGTVVTDVPPERHQYPVTFQRPKGAAEWQDHGTYPAVEEAGPTSAYVRWLLKESQEHPEHLGSALHDAMARRLPDEWSKVWPAKDAVRLLEELGEILLGNKSEKGSLFRPNEKPPLQIVPWEPARRAPMAIPVEQPPPPVLQVVLARLLEGRAGNEEFVAAARAGAAGVALCYLWSGKQVAGLVTVPNGEGLSQLRRELSDEGSRDRLAARAFQKRFDAGLAADAEEDWFGWLTRPGVLTLLSTEDRKRLAERLLNHADTCGSAVAEERWLSLLAFWVTQPDGLFCPLAEEVWRDGYGETSERFLTVLSKRAKPDDCVRVLAALDRADVPLALHLLAAADFMHLNLVGNLPPVSACAAFADWGARGAWALTRRLVALCRLGDDPAIQRLRQITAREFGGPAPRGVLGWLDGVVRRRSPRVLAARALPRLTAERDAHQPDRASRRLFEETFRESLGKRDDQVAAVREVARAYVSGFWPGSGAWPRGEARVRQEMVNGIARLAPQQLKNWAEIASGLSRLALSSQQGPAWLRVQTALTALEAAHVVPPREPAVPAAPRPPAAAQPKPDAPARGAT